MPVDTPFTVYRDELSLSHGLALWNPSHRKRIYDGVSIGDVGYLYEGTFIRMFNVTLPWDDPSNRLFGAPESYDLLYGPLGYTTEHRLPEVFTSRFVTAETNTDDAEVVTYKFRNRGALLSLPNGSHREDIIRAKMFEDHIRDHIEKWFNWSQDTNFGVQRMEDLILVSGRTMAYSWAAAACVDNNPEAEISLTSRTLRDFGTSFVWGNVRGHVSYHNSHFDPQGPFPVADQYDQCVFIRGFRAKRVLFVIRIIEIGNGRPDENPPQRPRQRNDELRNASSGDDLHIDGSSSSFHENPQRSPYQREGLRDSLSFLSHIWGSSASLDTIRPPINPQLLPYPSSTALQSNGSIYDASFMTSPAPDSLIEVLNDIAEVPHEDSFPEETTSITHDSDPSTR